MDIDNLRGVSTLFCMVAFAAVVYWAYGPSRKRSFQEAGEILFSKSELESIVESDKEKAK